MWVDRESAWEVCHLDETMRPKKRDNRGVSKEKEAIATLTGSVGSDWTGRDEADPRSRDTNLWQSRRTLSAPIGPLSRTRARVNSTYLSSPSRNCHPQSNNI